MAEYLYEGMFLLDSGKFAANHEGVAKEVVDIIEKAGGTVVAHRPWQDGRLAYSVDGHRKGTHYLSYFRMNGEALKDVERACKLNDLIVRHMILKHEQSLFDASVAALEGHVPETDAGAPPERSHRRREVEVEVVEEVEALDEELE